MLVVWGHDPKPEPLIVQNTINIDQGVVFGGKLTAYRYPEKEFVFVPAKQDYSGAEDNPLSKKEIKNTHQTKHYNGFEGY